MQNKSVQDLLAVACSRNAEVAQRRDAIKNLALLVEMHSQSADRESVYKQLLRQELLDVHLDVQEKSEIVDALCAQLAREPINGIVKELLWALGKTDGSPALAAAKAVVKCISARESNDNDVWQGILSLERLSYSVEGTQLALLLPALEELRKRVIVSGGVDNKKAIENLFARLRDRGLSVA